MFDRHAPLDVIGLVNITDSLTSVTGYPDSGEITHKRAVHK